MTLLIRKLLASLLVFIVPQLLLAEPTVTVQGTLMSFDKKIARIRTSEQSLIKVPLESLKTPPKGLVPGSAVVQAELTLQQMIDLNGDPSAKKGR